MFIQSYFRILLGHVRNRSMTGCNRREVFVLRSFLFSFLVSLLVTTALLVTPNLAAQAMSLQCNIGVWEGASYTSPAIAYQVDFDEYQVVYEYTELDGGPGTGTTQICISEVDRWGTPSSTSYCPTSSLGHDSIQPAVVYNPERQASLLVYSKDINGDGSNWDVYGRFLEGASNEFAIASSTADEFAPEVALSTTSNKFLVTWWQDNPSAPPSINAATVNSITYAVGAPFTVADHTSISYYNPDLAWDPTTNRFLVIYDDDDDVFARWVMASTLQIGPVQQPAGWPDWEKNPTIATCGEGRFLVGWQSLKNGLQWDVTLRFLKADGTTDPTDYYAPFGIYQSVNDHETAVDIACAHDASQYLVVWRQGYSADGTEIGIHGGTVTTGKQVSIPLEIRTAYPTSQVKANHPAVAGSRVGWMTAWDQVRPAAVGDDIYGRAVFLLFADGFEEDVFPWSDVFP